MNLYFFVEGETEKRAYPDIIKYFLPKMSKVDFHHQAIELNYCIFSGMGYPHLLFGGLQDSLRDVNDHNLKFPRQTYSHFIICIDAEEESVAKKEDEVQQCIADLIPPNCTIHIIVQNRCFETWFLGNRKIWKRNPQNQNLVKYQRFYDVQVNDPEGMDKMFPFKTRAKFHVAYLKTLLLERSVRYSKTRPCAVVEGHYLQEVVSRTIKNPSHLQSFQNLLSVFDRIS